MHSLGDVRKPAPLMVKRATYREETFDWLFEYERDGFTWFKTVSIDVFSTPEGFAKFLNEIITEVHNG